jgi:hypothetical protein
MTTDPIIATIPFTNGAVLPVFIDQDGKQHVLDDDGNRVPGVWVYVGEPMIVALETSRKPDLLPKND